MERVVPQNYHATVLRFDGQPIGNGVAQQEPRERLERLSQLLTEGLITQDEHAARRAAILDDL